MKRRIVLFCIVIAVYSMGWGASCGEPTCASEKDCQQGQICENSSCSFCSVSRPKACGNTCVDLQRDDQNCGDCGRSCPKGRHCQNGLCSCDPALVLCGEQCIDIAYNPDYCGDCNTKCKASESCIRGRCTALTCEQSKPPLTTCARDCVDLKRDTRHCGKCGELCRVDQFCKAGRCICVGDERECDGRCVDTTTHWEHCGGCGKRCEQGTFCSRGKCVTTCPKTTPHICYGGCFQLSQSRQHCGKCGRSCKPGYQCKQGNCERPCLPPLPDLCGEKCVDLESDREHCGACGQKCLDVRRCVKGKCVCPSGAKDCSGACVDTNVHIEHCGGCGNKCGPGRLCANGQCVANCKAGWILCESVCTNVQEERKHCGKCKNVCSTKQTCVNGLCQCSEGLSLCSTADGKSKVCTDTKNDPKHCGGCGKACSPGVFCVEGRCVCSDKIPRCGNSCCPKPYVCEPTAKRCVDLKTDPQHCGRLNNRCQSGELCCAGRCIAALSDEKNCGGCGVVCSSGLNCCSGKCLDTNEDFRHCGSCGKTCATGNICTRKSCIDPAWQYTFGGTGEDSANAFAMDASGRLYVAGTFEKTMKVGSTSLVATGSTDFFVFALADTGVPIWAVSFQNTSSVRVSAMVVDAQGHIIIVGAFAKSVTLGGSKLTSKGTDDLFVVKLDSKGKVIWAKSFGGLKRDRARHVDVDKSGNVYVGGYFNSTVFFGNSAQVTKGNHDVFVMKLDKNGVFQWVTTLGGKNFDECEAIVVDDLGSVYAVGSFKTTMTVGNITLKHKGETDIFVMRLSQKGGVVKWIKAFGGTGGDIARSVTVRKATGELYVTGHFSGSIQFDKNTLLGSKANPNLFVVGLDSGGNVNWAKRFIGTGYMQGNALALDRLGHVYVVGFFRLQATFGSKAYTSGGDKDAFVLKLDSTGQFVEVKVITGALTIDGLGAVIDRFGLPVVMGRFYGTTSVNKKPLLSKGKADIFVSRLSK